MSEAVTLPLFFFLVLAAVTISAALISRTKGKISILITGVVAWVGLTILIPALSSGPGEPLTFKSWGSFGLFVGFILTLALTPLYFFGGKGTLGKKIVCSIVGAAVTAPVVLFLIIYFPDSYEVDYKYISLINDMEVVKTGPPDVSGIHDHSEMPLQYRLERDTYVIHAVLDESSNLPTMIFSAESKENDNLYLSAQPINCYMYEDVIRKPEVDLKGFPANGVKLKWALGRLPPPCDNRAPLSEDEKVIHLVVLDTKRVGKIADENIRFTVEKNGGRTIYDSL